MAPTKKAPKKQAEERTESVLHMNIDTALLRDVKVVAAIDHVLMRDYIANTLRAECDRRLPKNLVRNAAQSRDESTEANKEAGRE